MEFVIIGSVMPPFEHFGSWLIDGLMFTLSMVISSFNYALTTLIVNEDRLLEFTAHSGRLIVVRHIRDEFHFYLTTQASEFHVTFNVDLRSKQHESNSGPAPDEQDPPCYHPQSDTYLVLPGVPFELPCPFCAHPLEHGQICDHVEQGQVVIWQYGPDLLFEDLQTNPFFVHEIHNFSRISCPHPTSLSRYPCTLDFSHYP